MEDVSLVAALPLFVGTATLVVLLLLLLLVKWRVLLLRKNLMVNLDWYNKLVGWLVSSSFCMADATHTLQVQWIYTRERRCEQIPKYKYFAGMLYR